ncbi:MAG: response regulator [Burkholderiales bacterium]|nr:response regulator [Burkholderiales bacterium]
MRMFALRYGGAARRRVLANMLRAPSLRRLRSLFCGTAATAVALLAPGAGAAAPDGIQTLTGGIYVRADSPVPPAAADGTAVALPDIWSDNHPGAIGSAWYLLDWEIADVPRPTAAIYLTGTTMPAEVFVNGRLVGATGAFTGPRPRSYQSSRLFVIPVDAIVPGRNVVAVHVYERSRDGGALGPVLVGPEPALRERALSDLFVHTLGPAVVSATIVVLGVFILVLWLRRRNPTYGLFGIAALLWGVHTGMSLLAEPPLPQPHWAIAWTAVYILFVALLCLFCLRFAERDWPAYRRAVVAYTLAVPLLLYAAAWAGALYPASVVVRLGAIVFVLVAFTAVARYALARRDVESTLLLVAGGVAIVFAIHDWLAAQSPTEIRPVMLVPYSGLAFLLLVGWILTDRFVRALNEYEALNAGLEARVAEKSEALEAQLEQTRAARDAAETANRAKTRFLAAASHDLRQPLHALGLFAARLSDRTRDPEDTALVARIATSVASLESLFSALLDISRLEAGVVAADARAVALDPLFARLANDFAPEAIENGLRFAVVPTRCTVRSDPVLLERILRNLVANALRYTREGGVVVGARRRGTQVAIEVWDSGPGIAPEHLDRVFEEFYQVGNPERDRSRGLGLGLAIVRRLAKLLGHDIDVVSQPGRGSVFRLRVAAAPAAAVASAAAAPSPPGDPLAGRRVLVIDDEEPVREGMRQTLVAWRCTPVLAADADAAVAACAGVAPDAMVVDYRLPLGRSGIDAIAAVRAALGRDVPAIVVSGESASDQIARIRDAGFTLLFKPVAPAKLRAALAHMLA